MLHKNHYDMYMYALSGKRNVAQSYHETPPKEKSMGGSVMRLKPRYWVHMGYRTKSITEGQKRKRILTR